MATNTIEPGTEGKKNLSTERRIQIHFNNAADAQAIEAFLSQLQSAYGLDKKYEAMTMMFNLAQKQTSDEGDMDALTDSNNKQMQLIAAQAMNLLRTVKTTLENSDRGAEARQDQLTGEIEGLKKQMAEKEADFLKDNKRHLEQKKQLQIQFDQISDENTQLKQEIKNLHKYINTYQRSETVWKEEQAALKEKLQGFEAEHNAYLSLKEQNATQDNQIQSLMEDIKEKEHQFALKLKDMEIIHSTHLNEAIAKETMAVETKTRQALEPINEGLHSHNLELKTRINELKDQIKDLKQLLVDEKKNSEKKIKQIKIEMESQAALKMERLQASLKASQDPQSISPLSD